jgi:hypothetical protein
MKTYILLFFILIICLNLKAQDTLLHNKKKGGIWQMQLAYSYCYNNRNTWLHLNNSNITNDEVLTYIDTSIIPCYTKRTAVQIVANLSRYFALQFGINYGRTGYMAAPIVQTNSYNGLKYAEISFIPELRTSITFATKINFPIGEFIKIGFLTGIEINPNAQNYFDESFYYLKEETRGIFGFKPSKNLDGNTIIKHSSNSSRPTQFNLGLITQINITKRIYSVIAYDYFSQFKKGLIIKDQFNSKPTFSYYIRSYTHSFSVGIGINLYK